MMCVCVEMHIMWSKTLVVCARVCVCVLCELCGWIYVGQAQTHLGTREFAVVVPSGTEDTRARIRASVD